MDTGFGLRNANVAPDILIHKIGSIGYGKLLSCQTLVAKWGGYEIVHSKASLTARIVTVATNRLRCPSN